MDEKYLYKELKNSQFSNALTSGTTLKILYIRNNNAIAYYVNIGPETGHQNDGIIVFINRKYHHNYYVNWPCDCKIKHEELLCQNNDFPDIIEHISLADLFSGKELLIGGGVERPWRGSHQIYK
ncbi:hypothetical protein [Novosphingobium sp.]|uniref:hypothetical protein n=1 Tax=Novosphingobium sp. TaxID=1874826 RepID=UPI003BA8A9FE